MKNLLFILLASMSVMTLFAQKYSNEEIFAINGSLDDTNHPEYVCIWHVPYSASELHSSNSVSSVNAYQEGKNIVITYKLSEESYINAYVSTDSGKSFIPLMNMYGDFGRNVKPGDKQIVWFVLNDYDKFIFSEVCFKITADEHNGHEFVDLGLPSGTKWATCNVGATKPEEYGDYFAWGETTTKSSYSSSNYYDNSTPKKLPLYKDVANVKWGGYWRMPTKVEQDELRNTSYTTWTWTTRNGVKGYKVTSKTNGNSIFLPAAGFRGDSRLVYAGTFGTYWSSSLYSNDSSYVYLLDFGLDGVEPKWDIRYFGLSVRAVWYRYEP